MLVQEVPVINRRHHIALLIIAAAALLSACVPSTPEPTPTPAPCPVITSLVPQVFSPNGVLVPSLQPTFQWFYEDCADAFSLEIALDGDFNVPGFIQEQVPGTQTTWTLTQALQTASMYQWRVHAIVGLGNGPYSPALWFWTGPICASSVPDIPELVSPIQGAIVNDPSPPIDWSYPDVGCLPEGYQFQVSAQFDFQQTVLSGMGSGPWTSFETNVDFLQDCTDYFWRVAALSGGQPTTYSDVEEFSTDFQGNCSAATAQGLEIYSVGCIGMQSTMITFEFPEAPEDIYEAHAEGNNYECVLNDERPMLLHCSGPRIETIASGQVELVVIETQEVVLTEQARFPNCAQPPCSGLGVDACDLRADCTWEHGITGGGGFCVDN